MSKKAVIPMTGVVEAVMEIKARLACVHSGLHRLRPSAVIIVMMMPATHHKTVKPLTIACIASPPQRMQDCSRARANGNFGGCCHFREIVPEGREVVVSGLSSCEGVAGKPDILRAFFAHLQFKSGPFGTRLRNATAQPSVDEGSLTNRALHERPAASNLH
ncbi:hypothetical protein [Novosphingobium sp. P6W]|uniref:hypothetical protein n=1 Tax=Novosphingobium sp. P6W TaxID=1609758 RepID=UPI0013B39713|nr:hypothetical protein [Novosphingobium sp. P6W]